MMVFCDNKCNITCQGYNNVNGLCDNGYTAGWKGAYCEECYYLLILCFWYYIRMLLVIVKMIKMPRLRVFQQ